MSKINEVKDKYVILRTYTLTEVNDIDSAVEWIEKVKKLPKLITKYISLEDTTHRSDEGNTSKQLSFSADKSEIYKEIKSGQIDDISLNAKYAEKPVVIGVDLNDKTVFITARNKNKADIEEMEKLLGLND